MYIIFKGSVSVIKSKEITISLNESEYISYLNILFSKNETDKINHLLIKNKFVFDSNYDKNLKNSNKPKKRKSIFFNSPVTDKISAEEYIDQFKIIEIKNDKIKKDVSIFEYYLDETLIGGDSFGDISTNLHLYNK